MVDFKKLKKQSAASFETLSKQIEKVSSSSFTKENENFWYPTLDKNGNGAAVIRFVPAPTYFTEDEEENTLFVRFWEHGFKGPTGKWYIEKSLTTIGQDDPVASYNTELWNTEIPAKQDIARKQKRKLYYVSNVLVIKDPENPENNGKVFKYKYGKKIFDKIQDAMNADTSLGEKRINAFDVFENGANFRVTIRKVDGYTNYDKSGFLDPSPLTEDQIEYVAANGFDLKYLVDPANFKSYEELEKRLHAVLDIKPAGAASKRPKIEEDDEIPSDDAPFIKDESSPWDTDSEDSDLDYFKKLTEDLDD